MMTKRIISIIFAIVLVFGLSVCVYAEEQRFVFDEASILTYDEIEELEADILKGEPTRYLWADRVMATY